MTTRRRYTKRQKATAVIAAEMSSVSAAAESEGIPESTLRRWMDHPDMAELRAKTREDLADEAKVLQQLAAAQIKARIAEFEPRDLTVLYGVMTDKAQLLSGQATMRTENRTLTEGMDDHEREALRKLLDEALAETG